MEILENTYKYVQKMKYPEGKLKVYVLDDGGLEEVKDLAARYGFTYIRRDDRPHMKKAGNLRWAFARTDGEFFVIYDADFCPRDDFLTELIPRMKENPKTAIIQTPQYFRTLETQTWVERGAGAVQELFYRYIQASCKRLFVDLTFRLKHAVRSIAINGVVQSALVPMPCIAEPLLSKQVARPKLERPRMFTPVKMIRSWIWLFNSPIARLLRGFPWMEFILHTPLPRLWCLPRLRESILFPTTTVRMSLT